MIYEYGKTIVAGQTVEVYRYERAPQVALGTKRKRTQTDSGGPRTPVPRRYDSIRRLKRGFTRHVQANLSGKGAPSFLTLTFATNADLNTGLQCFREFIALAKKEFGDGFSHITVPEFQKRGAVHFHCLCWGIADKYVENERYTRYIQSIWARGYVDIIPTDGSPKLASYLSKYMQKALQDERLYGRRAYYYSRNTLRPMLYKTTAVVHHAKEILGGELRLISEKTYSTEWLGEGKYEIYEIVDNSLTEE